MATIPTQRFIFVFGLSLTVAVSYSGDDGGGTTPTTSDCYDLEELCQYKIEVFNNNTICGKLKEVVVCLSALNDTCHQLQNSNDYDYYYDGDAGGQDGDSGNRNVTDYYYEASYDQSILDLISDMQTEYRQKCQSPNKSPSQGNASISINFTTTCHWMGLFMLLFLRLFIPFVLTLL